MDVVCLVRHASSKKKICVRGEKKLQDVLDALKESPFRELVTDNLLVQLYDKDFDDYIDMDENDVVEQHSVINIITTDEVINAEKKSDQEMGQDAELASIARNAPSTSRQDTQPALTVPLYRLPETPMHIQAFIKDIRKGNVPESVRRRIVDWVYYDVCAHTLYPGKLYGIAAQQLVRRYPELRDISMEGHVCISFAKIARSTMYHIAKKVCEVVYGHPLIY
ncbi:uncharacterized protein LOC135367817 [Ornithodoros turicata]|uniref:uncharacterized protein LOC135367817 n=1 Tax=Ornithodoros turicata TaxID=34597 RepID=UPI0031388F30